MKTNPIQIHHLPKDCAIFVQASHHHWKGLANGFRVSLPGVKIITSERPLHILIPPGKPETPTESGPKNTASRRFDDLLPDLPPIGDELVYPKDSKKIHFLGSNLSHCISALRDPESTTTEAKKILEDLRHHARSHGRTDIELIECITAWSGIRRPGKETIAAVWKSIEASSTAESPTDH
jgi:hypothetical protein